jgi:hypothetical protein
VSAHQLVEAALVPSPLGNLLADKAKVLLGRRYGSTSVPTRVAKPTGGNDVVKTRCSAIALRQKMLTGTLEERRFGKAELVSVGERLLMRAPHREAAIEATTALFGSL